MAKIALVSILWVLLVKSLKQSAVYVPNLGAAGLLVELLCNQYICSMSKTDRRQSD